MIGCGGFNLFSHSGDTARDAMLRITWLGAAVNLVLALAKLVIGGFIGHSQVLVADAIHSLSDLITDAAVLIGVRYWTRPADDDHPHGHSKIESLVTLLIGAALIAVGLGLIAEAVWTLHHIITAKPSRSLPTSPALVVALLSIVIKELLYHATMQVGRRHRSAAVMANAWHHRSDAWSSIPAAIAVAACMILGPTFAFLDPVGSVVVASMLVYTAWRLAAPAFASLLDAGVTQDQRQEIERVIRSFDAVRHVHKIRTRQLGMGSFAVDLHVHVNGTSTVTAAHHLSHEISARLTAEYPTIVDVAIHVEPDTMAVSHHP